MPLYYSIFRYFCSKNRTPRNFHHFIEIPLLISQKNDHNCLLRGIADKLPFGVKYHFCHAHHYCHITVSCPPRNYFINYLKTRFYQKLRLLSL